MMVYKRIVGNAYNIAKTYLKKLFLLPILLNLINIVSAAGKINKQEKNIVYNQRVKSIRYRYREKHGNIIFLKI